jgi:hypothetical protein
MEFIDNANLNVVMSYIEAKKQFEGMNLKNFLDDYIKGFFPRGSFKRSINENLDIIYTQVKEGSNPTPYTIVLYTNNVNFDPRHKFKIYKGTLNYYNEMDIILNVLNEMYEDIFWESV